jgi:hypothetical protein
MSKILFLTPIAALLIATTGWAEPPKADYGRPGWYAGVGAGGAWDFLEDAVSDATTGIVDLNGTGSFNARGGYRVTSWFALEAMYEGAYRYKTKVIGLDAGDMSTHSLLANFKFILPTWRIHPYIMIGPGAQLANFDGNGPWDNLDTKRWDFVLRTALGVDGYINENWLINLEAAPSIRFADYTKIPSEITDNVSLTVSLGVQYRF